MADHREQLARNLHLHSPRSTPHTRHESEGDREFSFWGSSNIITSSYNDCDQLGGNEAIRLNKEKTEFREKYNRTKTEFEHSPFLSDNCCSTLSDPSRNAKAIEEGRIELMEMIQDIPESSYELSFQDMVVDEKHMLVQQPDQNEASLMQRSSSNSNKAQLKKVNNKKKVKKSNSNNRPGQILRAESMESETFLLKMFFPISLKKVKVENGSSKVSPRPISSLQESIKQVGKEWRIKRFFQAGDKRGDMEAGMRQNTSSSSSIKSRYLWVFSSENLFLIVMTRILNCGCGCIVITVALRPLRHDKANCGLQSQSDVVAAAVAAEMLPPHQVMRSAI